LTVASKKTAAARHTRQALRSNHHFWVSMVLP